MNHGDHEAQSQLDQDIQRFRGVGSFSVVLLMIGATLLSQAFVERSVALRFVHLWLQVATLLLAIWTAKPSARLMRLSVLGSVSVAVLGSAALLGFGEDVIFASETLSLVFILIGYVVVITQVFRTEAFDLESVLATVSAYLLIGMGFTVAYEMIGILDGRFFVHGEARPGDYFFFSFATLTTVGYGDLVPATGLGRTLAVFEALVGQLYLVTIIANVVGGVASLRRQRGDAPRG